MREDLPVWRSLMFVPVNVEKFVKTAAGRGADGIILDLEDAVAPSQKEHARTLIADAIPHVSRNGADVLVRINRPWRMMVRDIEAAVIPGISALVLTKVDSAEHVLAVAEMVDELEAERNLVRGSVKFAVLVESTRGFFRMEDIARCHPRIVSMSLGSEDFAADAGMQSEPMGFVGSIADFRDQEAFRAIVRRSRRLGFVGASAIHPLQISVLNEEFSPRQAEVERAQRMVAAYDDAYAKGLGAVQFEGAMIDVPVVERARTILKRAEAIAGRLRRLGA
jgi:citrate lyase subunit beta/citryl-CoA lyase